MEVVNSPLQLRAPALAAAPAAAPAAASAAAPAAAPAAAVSEPPEAMCCYCLWVFDLLVACMEA